MTAIENIINQIENETRRFGNTKTRVAAVLRLIKAKLVDLFSGKLDKGRYAGTADDLNNAIGNKVDKVPGKILSSNDFTNELRTKLEGLQNVDISQLLPKGGYTGTAQNLKELIDNIMRILQSPDTELDELREIVAFIKQNKRTLDTLGINNIAGLQDALRGKAPIDHNHDDRYSRLGHTHTEYALRTHTHSEYAPKNHRHNWDDIDGKPEIATYKTITDAHKFLDKDGAIHFGSGDSIVNAPSAHFYEMVGFTHSSKNWGFIIAKNLDVNDGKLYVKQVITGSYTAWFELNRNSENISIRNYIECNHNHNGSVIFVENLLTIQLKDLISLDCVSFRKVFAGGQVTFTCDGKQIIYTGDNAFNGGDGSTAVVSIWNNKCYIDIRNI
nr:MAG TPA: hypothetical protein [Caudoviricetes sp.]